MGKRFYVRKGLTVLTLVLVVICIFWLGKRHQIQFLVANDAQTIAGSKKFSKLDLSCARDDFENSIYSKWETQRKNLDFTQLLISQRCSLYFSELEDFQVNLKFWSQFKVNPLVYKKKKWIKDITRAKRKEIRRKNWKPEYDQEIADMYEEEQAKYAHYERQIFDDVSHMKVFGKCMSKVLDDEMQCLNLEKKLYPWLKGLPLVQDAEGNPIIMQNGMEQLSERCIIKNILATSQGRGIVIPVNGTRIEHLVDYIERLLVTLKVMKNRLPIAIFHKNLSADIRARIANTSKSNDDNQYPLQSVMFFDLTPVTDYSHIDVVAQSLMFNHFQEVILLTENIIPLTDLNALFDENFKESAKETKYIAADTLETEKLGVYFFKYPSVFDKSKATPGYYDINHFIRNVLLPSTKDSQLYNLKASNTREFKRYFEDDFKTIIDPNVMMLNKSQALNGLLIALSLEFYDPLKLRINLPDIHWIAHRIAGTKIKFHNNPSVMAGMYTPEKSSEICSSSFGQLSDVDSLTLLFITSHQLQNWLEKRQSYTTFFEQKYVTTYKEEVDNIFDSSSLTKTIMERTNDEILQKLMLNPLTVENIIVPPTLTRKVHVKSFEEPNEAWVEQKKHIPERSRLESHKYYCVYSDIGDVFNGGTRGPTINVRRDKKELYGNVTVAWLNKQV